MWYPAECVWMLDYVPGLALNQFLSWMYDESPLIAVTENTVITSGSTWLKPLYLNGTADLDSVVRYTDGLASGSKLHWHFCAGNEFLKTSLMLTWL